MGHPGLLGSACELCVCPVGLCKHLGQEIEAFLPWEAETAVRGGEDLGLGSVHCDCGFFFLDLIAQELTMLFKHYELRAHGDKASIEAWPDGMGEIRAGEGNFYTSTIVDWSK
jgi:hypothetical protein